MTSNIVTTRVALGDLNVNSMQSPFGESQGPSSATAEKLGKTTTSPLKSQKIFGAARPAQLNTDNRSTSIHTKTQLSSTKRSFEVSDECWIASPSRRHKKRNDPLATVPADKVGLADDLPAELASGRLLQRDISGFHQRPDERHASGSSTPESPVSPFGDSNSSTLEDSQNTVVTEPDSPPSRVMTSGELRQKARAMKLRLRLAAYKVQSNQMDIPITQLRIKTSTPPSPMLPTRRRTPLPSAVPNIKLQTPSTEQQSHTLTNISSSPPSYRASEESLRKEAFATPLLPRQRQRLLYPPNLDSPTWKDGGLTSSAVKGKAADSLLSLMRQQC